MSGTIELKVIIGSTRQGRFSEKPAAWIAAEAAKLEGVRVETLDLREYPLPYYAEPISPSRFEGRYPSPEVERWSRKIAEGDAFIIVTPEYNHGAPAVLKNALDYVYAEWNRKPVGFVSWGSVGGARVVEQLRQVVVELQMAPIRNAIHIPPQALMDIKAGKETETFAAMKPFADSFFSQLLWWAKALKSAREGTP